MTDPDVVNARRPRPILASVDLSIPWRDQLDLALDAMKERRIADAERLFDELDVIYAHQEPHGAGWHFEVHYRRNRPVHQSGHLSRHQYTDERRAKQIVAAMLMMATVEAHRKSHPGSTRPYTVRHLGIAFGVGRERSRIWLRAGLRDLGLGDCAVTCDDFGMLEDDFEPADVRRERRRKEQQRKDEYAAWISRNPKIAEYDFETDKIQLIPRIPSP